MPRYGATGDDLSSGSVAIHRPARGRAHGPSRIREGGFDAESFAIYRDREPRPGMAEKRALGQIEAIRALCDKYPEHVGLATTAQEVRDVVASGRLAAVMGVEGGYRIEDDLRVLRIFHALGVRYMSLTHGFNTHRADSSGTGNMATRRRAVHRARSTARIEEHQRQIAGLR